MKPESSEITAPTPGLWRRFGRYWQRPWWRAGLGLLVVPVLLGGLSVALTSPASFSEPILGVSAVLLSLGFLIPLSAELVGWAVWSTRSSFAADRILFTTPALVTLVPAALGANPVVERAALLVASGYLVVWFVLALQYVYRHKQIEDRVSRFLPEVCLLTVLASAGWVLWAFRAVDAGLVLSVVAAPLVLARSIPPLERAPASDNRVPWLLRPFWVFQLLLFAFLTEFFLGAILDLEIAGPSFLQYIPFLPLAGPVATIAANAVYDGLWFAAAILASAWFLVALGITMGGLVVLRMRDVHVPAQKYRMGLMLGVYALAAVFLPSLTSSTPLVSNATLASLPVVGWGFGLRDGGPFAAGVFLAVIVMYVSVGVLTVLFGRKALCSVMCGAAMMYQSSTVHEMRAFHQTSRVGRYFLGSRLSTAYAVASGLALVSLFGVSLLAVLHRLPLVQVASGQFDTSALPLPIELYFGGIWFVMFVATPYIGTYNCVSTGFCHWGALSVPFAKVSFFRLRVKDKKVCQACTTFECAKSCPVGLVDMPLYFRSQGEYRSTKCCGVGDCVGACPYGNLYHQDVRFWLLRGLSRLRARRGPQPLPMVPVGRTTSPDAPPPVATEGLPGGPT
jgi:hypothetical protein